MYKLCWRHTWIPTPWRISIQGYPWIPSEPQASLGYMRHPSQNINHRLTSKNFLEVYRDTRKPYRVSHFAWSHYGRFVGMMIDHVRRRLVTVG